MKRLAAMLLLVLVSMTVGQPVPDDQPAPPSVRFTNVDISIDPNGQPLAAYQLEFIADSRRVTLVGIEGGEHPAFHQPPYYDPKALHGGGKVILAALNAGNNLPAASTRVARLHLQISGAGEPEYSARLIVAASSNDKTIQAKVSVGKGVTP